MQSAWVSPTQIIINIKDGTKQIKSLSTKQVSLPQFFYFFIGEKQRGGSCTVFSFIGSITRLNIYNKLIIFLSADLLFCVVPGALYI